MENPTKLDDLGGPLFSETPIWELVSTMKGWYVFFGEVRGISSYPKVDAAWCHPTIVAALLVESFNSDELKFNFFPWDFSSFFFWRGSVTGYISSTFAELLNILKISTAETKIVWSHWETAKLWCFEAEVWTLTVFRSEFLHPHHAQHPSKACLAKLLVWCIEDWICLTAIFLPFVSIFSMYAAYMFVQWVFLA